MQSLTRIQSARARVLQYRPSAATCHRSFATNSHAYADGDYVLLCNKTNARTEERLIKLRAGKTRDTIYSPTDHPFMVTTPTLEEYVRLVSRRVTPIYAHAANTIVSLLDLHPDPGNDSHETSPPLEIFEAGTGHGGLTLHLARAIHAANPPRPRVALTVKETTEEQELPGHLDQHDGNDSEGDAALDIWKKSRKAIIHTLDNRSEHTKIARRNVKDFRRGLYAGNVEFYNGDIKRWIQDQMDKRGSTEPFLSHAILDLPSAEDYIEVIEKALRVGGILAIFNPSITQISDSQAMIRDKQLGLTKDQVIELSPPRQWEVFQTRARALARATPGTSGNVHIPIEPAAEEAVDREAEDMHNQQEGYQPTQESSPSTSISQSPIDPIQVPSSSEPVSDPTGTETNTIRDLVTVCRPRIHGTIVGSAFLGVWSKRRNWIKGNLQEI